MLDQEDAYGLRKRLAFASELITRRRPESVVEVGCGSGALLIEPLARAFPEVEFFGLDPDSASIENALLRAHPDNLDYAVGHAPLGRHDIVIASEVIEHVESPRDFLLSLRSHLKPGGAILLTTPNGHGPFELALLLQALLAVSGLLGLMQRAWRPLRRAGSGAPPLRDTLAVSPHINFFSWRDMHRIFSGAGLAVEAYRGRTWLCGFGFDLLGRSRRLANWNAALGDNLPPALVSDWMFILAPTLEPAGNDYKRSRWASFRRRLNEQLAATQSA